jgi:hypothetical protein
MRALAKQRDQRFPHMRAFADALEAVPELPDTIPRDSLVAVRTSSPGSASSPERLSTPMAGLAEGGAPAKTSERASDASLTPTEVSVGEITFPGRRSPNLVLQRAYVPLAAGVLVVGALVSALVLAKPEQRSARGWSAQGAAEPALGATVEGPNTATTAVAPAPAKPVAAPITTVSTRAASSAEVEIVPEAASPDLVTVRVSTRPSGARLSLAGGPQVCAKTPCDVEVLRGKPVSLIARHGKQRAMTRVEPRDGAQVLLVLDATTSPTPDDEKSEAENDLPSAFR